MNRMILIALALASSFLASMAQSALANGLPGTAQGLGPRLQAERPEAERPMAASGLRVFYRKYGKLSLSVDAAGSNNSGHMIKVRKPSNTAKVDKAFLMASSYFQTVIDNGDIRLAGKSLTWMDSESNDMPNHPRWFNNVLADVTSIVKPKVDSARKGTIRFRVREIASKNSKIDGEILVVVFKDQKLKEKTTIALLFGGQSLNGDRFEITLSGAIDPLDSAANAEMGLGISHSFRVRGSQQYSVVDVNGKRLTSAAGGQDDGSNVGGGLITVGGVGDSRRNPSNARTTPANPRADDERYDLLPFLTRTSRTIRVDTRNPSQDDNMFFAWFKLSEDGDVNLDTDGDGLLDSWEKNGYDHDGDGVIDVPLHKLGANFMRKDIFIAYAWMEKSATETESHQPSMAVLSAVTEAFARAPVKNGIKVHWLNKGSVPHDEDLSPVWDEFDALMDPLVSEAERRIYHRMLNAHAYEFDSSSGLSRGLPASDFIESLGRWPSNPGTFEQRAGTIMHELGHNLGLRHGGVDHVNYKPNHLSVMSYHNQVVWLIRDGQPFLDFERFDMRDLNEYSLSETAGLDVFGKEKSLAGYGVRWFANGFARSKTTGANQNVDWNGDGLVNSDNVVSDLNRNFFGETLRGNYPEWDNIIFTGGSIGAGEPFAKPNFMTKQSDLDELTYEKYRELFPAAR